MYNFPKEETFFTKENLVVNYIYEEDYPMIVWALTSDTTTLDGLICQKAIGHFKGREWIAWFVPDPPFPFGPWKLNGLPGLILDAHDRNDEVILRFDGFIDKGSDFEDMKDMDDNSNKNYLVCSVIALPDKKVTKATKKRSRPFEGGSNK